MKIKIFSFNISLNGQLCSIKTYKRFSLDDLRIFFDCQKNLIVLEYNGRIIHPNNWSNIILNNLDKIEILTIVGGG